MFEDPVYVLPIFVGINLHSAIGAELPNEQFHASSPPRSPAVVRPWSTRAIYAWHRMEIETPNNQMEMVWRDCASCFCWKCVAFTQITSSIEQTRNRHFCQEQLLQNTTKESSPQSQGRLATARSNKDISSDKHNWLYNYENLYFLGGGPGASGSKKTWKTLQLPPQKPWWLEDVMSF